MEYSDGIRNSIPVKSFFNLLTPPPSEKKMDISFPVRKPPIEHPMFGRSEQFFWSKCIQTQKRNIIFLYIQYNIYIYTCMYMCA